MSITSKSGYIEVKEAGKGAFGRCTLARAVNNPSLANIMLCVKEIKLDRFLVADNDEAEENAEMVEMIKEQGPLLCKLNHVNIVKGFGFFEEASTFYVVTEYCDSGDLRKAIANQRINGLIYFHEVRILAWTVQLILALEYLHDRCIIHRDIKPSNLFLHKDGRVVKVGSFGIAKQLQSADEFVMGQIGTMTHVSPEMIEGRAVTLKTDIWALGVTLYELASLHLPFENVSPVVLCQDIVRRDPKPLPTRYSERFRTLIEAELMSKDPANRPSMKQLLVDRCIVNAIAEMIIDNEWGFNH